MNLVSFMDLLTITSLLYILFVLAREIDPGLRAFRTAMGFLIAVFLIYTVLNILERTDIGGLIDPYDEFVEVLIPVGYLILFSISVFSGKESIVLARGRVLNAINAITEKLPVRQDPKLLWKELLLRVIDTMELDGGFMYLADDRETIRVNHNWELPGDVDLLPGDLDITETILSRVLATEEPLVLEHTEAMPDQFIQALRRSGVTSAAFFPLTTETRVLGVMGVVSLAHRRFSEVGLDLFKMLGHHLGEIILNNKLLNETRDRTSELTEALDTKKRFLSMISHELRDPLTVVKGVLFLIKDEFSGDLDEEFKKAVEVAVVNSWKLEKLVDEILDLSRLDAGEIKLNFTPINPGKELGQLVDEAMSASVQKGVVLHSDIQETLSPIEVDRYRFHQVVQNLLSNAIKYTPEGGRVTIQAKEEDENFVIVVTDTGIGIGEEDVNQVFDMFYRTKAAVDTIRSGSGIGLAIVKEIVILHDGDITVESKLGEGSVFTVTMPRMQLV
ncbi:MAG: sensor histidine kinase [bacterium]